MTKSGACMQCMQFFQTAARSAINLTEGGKPQCMRIDRGGRAFGYRQQIGASDLPGRAKPEKSTGMPL